MNSFAIETEGLCREFNERVAVSGLSIKIKKGEIFSLLGTNGAGKTTTIKMLSGLLKPSSGRARVCGYDVENEIDKIKQLIGVSPQETAIAKHLSTKENLHLIGGIYGLKNQEAKRRAVELMELMELEDRKDQVRKLSGGMQRRLSIAMALMADPEVIFLDEPTLGLDPHARRSVWNYIEKLKGDKTILLTTHYLDEADWLADQIAIMDNSKIIETGTSGELKEKYQSAQILKIQLEDSSVDYSEVLTVKGADMLQKGDILEIKSPKIDFYMIIDLLKTNNARIKNIQMKEPTLDEVFIHLTGKEAQS